ncbi:MAG: D-alanyl-D-alanine carboxypeptidase, partial [Longimicrobiales bacterium]|nr:D-alanyl-D-alanine carboxypeptidase [Longimicrobiales bacterium]
MRSAPPVRTPGRRTASAAWLFLTVAACAPPSPTLAAQGPVPAPARDAARDTGRSTPAAVLDSILRTPPLSRAHWGVAVHDLATGRPLLLHNADRLFTAASTMKLVTAAAALDLLGPDYRFRTVARASVDELGRADSLVVRGGGDPTLGAPFHDDPL